MRRDKKKLNRHVGLDRAAKPTLLLGNGEGPELLDWFRLLQANKRLKEKRESLGLEPDTGKVPPMQTIGEILETGRRQAK